MKRTWKLKALSGDVAMAMRSEGSVTEAAKVLRVDRGTVHRWLKANKSPRLAGVAAGASRWSRKTGPRP